MKIDQKDFLKEYIKDKPDFEYKQLADYNFIAETDYYFISVYDFEDNFYCKIQSTEFGNMPLLADFILTETYEEFKTVMDIFLGMK